MGKRILVVFTTGNIYRRRGLFNAVMGRTKHLEDICGYEMDVLLLSTYLPWYVRLLRNTGKVPRPSIYEADGPHNQGIQGSRLRGAREEPQGVHPPT